MPIESLSDISKGGTSAFAAGGADNLTVSDTAPLAPAVDDVWVDTAAAGLGTASTADLTTSATDTTAGRVLTTGAFNLGAGNFAKNKIINGKMEIAQRGTSFPAAASGYTLDRWVVAIAGPSVIATTEQNVNVPSNNEFQRSNLLTVTTADPSITGADIGLIGQMIEGFNARDLIGKTFTLSFWVRSSKTGVHCIGFRNDGTDRSFVAEYTVTAANTWEFKSVTIAGGLITAGTWNWTTGRGLIVSFILASGPTFQTTPNTWQTGNFVATSNQVNCLDTIGNVFGITGVQLEVGSVATPFEHRPYGHELALCQRYYNSGIFYVTINSAPVQTFYPVTMRVAPTVAGGGAGFVVPNHADKEKKLSCSQTTPADQTLTFSAEL